MSSFTNFRKPNGKRYTEDEVQDIVDRHENFSLADFILSSVICAVFVALAVVMIASIDYADHYFEMCICILVCVMGAIAFGLKASDCRG